jgi:hypothetical protein
MDAIVCPADSYVGKEVCKELQVRFNFVSGVEVGPFRVGTNVQTPGT